MVLLEYCRFILNSPIGEILKALVAALIIEALLVGYLQLHRHINVTVNTNSRWILCIQWNDAPHGAGFRVPGSAAAFSAGIPQWLYHYIHGFEWLQFWALVGAWVTLFSVVILAFQLVCIKNRNRVLVAKSHGLLWDACGQAGVLDPFGLIIFLLQIVGIDLLNWKWAKQPLWLVRNFLALPHAIAGAVVMIIAFNPIVATVLRRRPTLVLASPIPWKVFE